MYVSFGEFDQYSFVCVYVYCVPIYLYINLPTYIFSYENEQCEKYIYIYSNITHELLYVCTCTLYILVLDLKHLNQIYITTYTLYTSYVQNVNKIFYTSFNRAALIF